MNQVVNENRKMFWKEGSKVCGFAAVRIGNYFGGEPTRRTEVEVRVGNLKNGNAAGRDNVTGEMIKGGGNRVVDWIWRLRNMAFESGVVPDDWKFAVVVPLYKGKGEDKIQESP